MLMSSSRILYVILFAVPLFLLSGCTAGNSVNRSVVKANIKDITMNDFLKMDSAEISSIDFNKGKDRKTIKSKEDIEKTLKFLQAIKYKRLGESNEEAVKGWNYSVQIYDKTAKVENRILFSFLPAKIIFNNKNESYECSEDILNGIDALYNSIEDK